MPLTVRIKSIVLNVIMVIAVMQKVVALAEEDFLTLNRAKKVL
jgi:hypothetical protein